MKYNRKIMSKCLPLNLQLWFTLIVGVILLNANLNYAQNISKKVLFTYGGWEGHDPEGCKELFTPWLEAQGFEVILSQDLNIYTDSDIMNSVDLIIQNYTMGELTEEQSEGLLSVVHNGKAIAGWHGGLGDSFRENTDYQFMVGGQWVAHPGGIIDFKVNIVKTDDPIVKGIADFNVNSEQYYMHVDPGVEVLATTTFSGEHREWIEGTVMPVVWKKRFGKGKVFYSSLGHEAKDFESPETFTIMQRGILWALDELE